jgi:hypothetical protein
VQLEKVNKFIAEQKEMEARLEEQAKQIEADAANHAHVISELERKHVQVGGCFTLVPFCHSTEVPTPRCSGEGPAQKRDAAQVARDESQFAEDDRQPARHDHKAHVCCIEQYRRFTTK